ncbi:MAG: IS3 family transposase [Bacteroidales bacterium]|nr:IS3 family transposase [Bacteroidales bacterium]
MGDWAQAIEGLRREGHPLQYMLGWVKMARSTFYYHLRRMGNPDGYDDVRDRIREVYDRHQGRYGYRRITLQLHNGGMAINHKTVRKLMEQMGLKAKRRKQHYRSYKGSVGKAAPNILHRDFTADRPNRKWATDVTQINIRDRKLYISPILDMYNGEIVSCSISASPDLKMVMSMLDKAFRKVKVTTGTIMHSDQGWHYQHTRYQKALKEHGIIQSMSRKGNCLDNAMMESFFGLMKTELLYLHEWSSVDAFEKALRAYIHYYNNDRIKLRLNGKSPVQYRTLFLHT